MPYIDGETLWDRLTRQGALAVPEAARLLRDRHEKACSARLT
jgi:hypothetical protein